MTNYAQLYDSAGLLDEWGGVVTDCEEMDNFKQKLYKELNNSTSLLYK